MKVSPSVTETPAANPLHRLRGFAAELYKRHVLKTGLWYIGVCVAGVQAADSFLPALGMSEATLRLLKIIAIFGLPVALTLSWEFDVAPASVPTQSRHKWLRSLLIVVVAMLSLTGALFVWHRQPNKLPPVANATSFQADPAHVAVLPFTSASTDAELVAFAFNLQERLIDGLSIAAATGAPSSKRLHIVSQPTIQSYSGPGLSIDSIRRALNVGTIINGSVEAVGDAVRVRVRLVDAGTGDQLATSVTEMRARDRLALLPAVADSALLLVRQQLGVVVRNQTQRMETQNLDAFNRFAAAMQRLNDLPAAREQRDFRAAHTVLDDADSLLAQAEHLDPHWIEPIVQRGQVSLGHAMIELASGPSHNEGAYLTAGLRHADRALKLQPDDYRALELRGYLGSMLASSRRKDMQQSRQIAAVAEHDLRMSLVNNPTPATCYRLLSELANAGGRLEEALAYGQRAYDEDPYLEQVESTVFRMFEYSLQLGRDADAEHWCSEGRNRFLKVMFDDCRLMLAAWSKYPLTPDSALTVVTHELTFYPQAARALLEPRLAGLYAAVLARRHMPDSARAVLAAARRRDNGTVGMQRVAAGVYTLLGSRDMALLTIKELLAAHPEARGALEKSPELRLLRTDPEFHRLTQLAD